MVPMAPSSKSGLPRPRACLNVIFISLCSQHTCRRQKSTFAFRLHYLYDGASVVCALQLCIFYELEHASRNRGSTPPEPTK